MNNNELSIISNCDASPIAVRADKKNFPRIKDFDRQTSIRMMYQIIAAVQIYANKRMEKEDMLLMTQALYAELMADDFNKGTRNLAWVDIQRAVRRGVLGAGKQMYGISVSTLYQAILDYLDEVVKPAQDKLFSQKSNQDNKEKREHMTMVYAKMMEQANEERNGE